LTETGNRNETPIQRAEHLKREIKASRDQLDQKEKELDQLYRTCNHQWGETVYAPEHIEGYEIPGDEPGTMGVDFRGPVYVSPKTIRKWKRTCKICGLVQITERFSERETSVPVFPS
jgi:hypothetical protein